MGHKYRHHSLCSKPKTAEQMTAPAVISSSSQADSDAWSLSSHTLSHTRIPKKSAYRNQGPHFSIESRGHFFRGVLSIIWRPFWAISPKIIKGQMEPHQMRPRKGYTMKDPGHHLRFIFVECYESRGRGRS